MTTARARRSTFIALAVSLVAFLALNIWHTLTWGRAPGLASLALLVVTLGGVLAAQWLTLDLVRDRPNALVKAAALQPVWPFLVFLIGIAIDDALRASQGMPDAGSPLTMALVSGAGLGIVGVGLVAARAGLGRLRPPVMLAG
jgi:hypothetical protein